MEPGKLTACSCHAVCPEQQSRLSEPRIKLAQESKASPSCVITTDTSSFPFTQKLLCEPCDVPNAALGVHITHSEASPSQRVKQELWCHRRQGAERSTN